MENALWSWIGLVLMSSSWARLLAALRGPDGRPQPRQYRCSLAREAAGTV
jgi:hypothetical protein